MIEAKQSPLQTEHKAEQFKLVLENGETVICSRIGRGKKIAFIPGGPGTFYFKGLTSLYNKYTFIACDGVWTYRPPYGPLYGQRKPEEMTRENIKKREHLVMNALKKHFKTDKIDGFAFSAPGAFLFEEALENPKDYDCIIGTGIALTSLGEGFSKTTEIFEKRATKEQKEIFAAHQEKYKELQSGINLDKLIDQSLLTFFGFKADEKVAEEFKKEPYKRFVAESMAMAAKLFFDCSDMEKVRKRLMEHWESNPFGECVDKNFQEHFFMNIYPQLKPLQTIIELAKTGKRILLIYGESDFITPFTYEILQKLAEHPSITTMVLGESGHVPYVEAPKEYSEIVMDFVEKGEINASQSIPVEMPRSRL